jgi:hypothetical protein
MIRLLILVIIAFSISFTHQNNKTPYLSKLIISPDKDPCNAPNAIFREEYSNNNLALEFGYDGDFKKQDTIRFSYKNDSLFIKVIQRNKPRIVFKNGIPDTLPGLRDEEECECYTLFNLEIKDLPGKPKCIVVNKYIHDDKLGFVTGNYLQKARASIQSMEKSKKFLLDSAFVLPPHLNSYPDMDALTWYLKLRGSLCIKVLDADTPSEHELVKRLQRLLIKKRMICPTRVSEVLNGKVFDSDSTTITIKISETGSFLFPEYNWRTR